MPISHETDLAFAVALADQAGKLLTASYEQAMKVDRKSKRDIVTNVDYASEALVIKAIHERFPGDAILAEESGRTDVVGDAEGPELAVDQRVWIVDPLDGTVNYANGIPVFCVSVGLAIGGRPMIGVVYDPTRDEMFTAIAGRGAQLDGVPIRHPTKAKLSDAVVSLALPHYRFARREGRIRKAIRVARNMGSASLALTYVANGRFDAFVQQGGLSLWDIAAAGLIAEEGGATVTDVGGGPWFDLSRASRSIGLIAAGAPHHAALREMLG